MVEDRIERRCVGPSAERSLRAVQGLSPRYVGPEAAAASRLLDEAQTSAPPVTERPALEYWTHFSRCRPTSDSENCPGDHKEATGGLVHGLAAFCRSGSLTGRLCSVTDQPVGAIKRCKNGRTRSTGGGQALS